MLSRDPRSELSDRTGEILRLLIRMHITSCDPVGSQTLARSFDGKLSPATIRNIMANLEEGGYLLQPHTSSGRVPSDKGYRFYVDSLAGTRLSKTDERMIGKLFDDSDSPEDILSSASRLLSSASGNVGIVIPPPLESTQMMHVEFMNLGDNKILMIFVSKAGLLQKKVIRLQEPYSQAELERAGRFLVERFSGKTLAEIRSELFRLMEEERVLYDRMLRLMCAWKESLDAGPQPETGNVYLQGAAQIVHQPEFADVERLRTLFEMFEEKGRLVKILNACLMSAPAGGVKIAIGSEMGEPSMRPFTVIVSSFVSRDNTVGFLGIIGPTRMEYERGISIVGHLAGSWLKESTPEASVPHGPIKTNMEDNVQQPDFDSTDTAGAAVSDLSEAFRKLQAERDDLYDRLLRKQAEFENFRKRSERERAEYVQMASADLMKEILNVLDSFEIAIQTATGADGDAVLRGFELIQKQFVDTLGRFGVKAIEAKDMPFDPNFHRAVTTVETGDAPDDTVVQELRKGYLLHGRLLRETWVGVKRSEGSSS